MKLLIFINDEKERKLLEDCLMLSKNVDVVSCKSYDEVLEKLYNGNYDALIYEIELKRYDEISMLENVVSKYGKKTDIVAILPLEVDWLEEKVCSFGIEYVFVKPYDIELLKRRLLEIKENNKAKEKMEINVTPNDRNELERKISVLLNNSGILPNLKGYKYLKFSLMVSYGNYEILECITKFLYPAIAKKYKTTSESVERAIRHAITAAWDKKNNSKFFKEMGLVNVVGDRRPTNSEYIFTAYEYLKNQKD